VAFLHALLVIAAFVGVAAIPCALGLLIISLEGTIGRATRGLRRTFARLIGRADRAAPAPAAAAGPDQASADAGQGSSADAGRGSRAGRDGGRKGRRPGGRPLRGIRRVTQAIGRRFLRGRLGNRWLMARLAMSVRVGRKLEHSEPTSPPIQQVAADLRRLNRQRLSIAMRSRVWFQAVQHAYDDRLGVACRQLGIEQHLDELTGMDLDLERLRVEGLLEEAGLALRDDSTQPRHWQL
jgi:hypothetical protein